MEISTVLFGSCVPKSRQLQKTHQQFCSPAKLLISLLEGVMSGHPLLKASVSSKETNHFWQKNEPAEICSTNNSQPTAISTTMFQPLFRLRNLRNHVPLATAFFFTIHLKGEILGLSSNYRRLPFGTNPSSWRATCLGDLLATSKDCCHQDILAYPRISMWVMALSIALMISFRVDWDYPF